MSQLSEQDIEKGASAKASPFSSGAIGGMVSIRTLDTQDILKSGEQLGALVKVNTHNNSHTPDVPESFGLQNYYEVSNDNNTLDFAGGGFTLATAYEQNNLKAVLAYSKKKVGNYFAGSNGFEEYIEEIETKRFEPPKDVDGNPLDVPYSEYELVDHILLIPPPVNQNGEVVNKL